MIGHPDALPKQVATGIVQGISGLYLDVTVDASGGNSGSGILDANGQLNGVFFRGGCGASGGLTYNGAMSMANLIILSPILTSLAVPPPSACPTFQITAQPANITVNAPGVATFSVTANGTPSSYQWQLSTDGGSSYSDIAGATTRTYTTGATNNLMSGYRYRCAVVNSCSFVQISNAAILTIGGNPVSILSSWSNNRVDKVPGTNRALVLIVNAKVSGPFSVTARYGGYSGSLMTLVVEKTQGTAYTGAFILNEAGIAAAPNGQFQVDYSSNPIAVSGTTVFLSNVNQTTLIGAISTGGTSGALTVSTGALANSSGDMEILGATALIDGNYSLNNGFVRGGVEQTLGWGDIVAGYAGGLGSSIIPSVTLSSSTTQSIIGFVVKSIGSTGTPNVSPTVSISSPTNGATFTAPATITINANAADGDGSVSKVEFFQGATKLGEDLTAPYSFAWTGIAAGNYSITAKATDNLGATTTSTAISVNVGNVSTGNVTPVGTWLTGTTHAKEVGTNRALVVLVYGERGGPMSVDSVTYGGKRMTLIVAKSQGTTTNSYTGAFILKEAGVAAATNGTIAVKWASAPSGSQVMNYKTIPI